MAGSLRLSGNQFHIAGPATDGAFLESTRSQITSGVNFVSSKPQVGY